MSSRAGAGVESGERLRDLAHIASSVGHHLINSYSSVVSNAEMLRSTTGSNAPSPDAAALAGSIVSTALEASRVARSLIAWTRDATRHEAAGNTLAQEVDLPSLIHDVVESERASAPTNIDWRLDLKATRLLLADPGHLESMLRALARNAVEALDGQPGFVAYRTGIDASDWVFIEIEDNGRGMTGDVLNRATEPFFTTKSGHAGVGLTIAQGIWRRHQGTMAIESRVGQGTMVRLAHPPINPNPRPANRGDGRRL